MLSKKDKKIISKKYWNNEDHFVHPTMKDYNPYGVFHDFDGLEKQMAVFSSDSKTNQLFIMTLNDEGNPSIIPIPVDVFNKK